MIGTSTSPSTIDYQPSTLFESPVLIDTTRCPAFIELNSSLFIFHRFKKRLGLTFAHLTFFFHFGLRRLGIFVRWFLWFFLACSFHFTGNFFLRRFRRRNRCPGVFSLSRPRHGPFVAVLLLRCTGGRAALLS